MANGTQGSTACEQALRGALAAGRQKEEEVAPRRLSCQISANQRGAETCANVNKHWKTRAKGNDVITNVISALPPFSRPAARAPQRACSQAKLRFPSVIYHEIHEFLHKYYLNMQEKNILLFATFETSRNLSNFAMTSGIVTEDRGKNYPRNYCGMHFGSSSLLVSEVAN